ncbi:putative transporter [Cyphellophora attinorum]|uniref:Putative transporter n=1 Tax=Cyphellophora attinorum TaxID=1664694 RepID=A0A0N1H9R1_9EURO|nr:putative transporter [Phialophora attinorum]KPI44477.1 putative transporter [Phialophora attinorum]
MDTNTAPAAAKEAKELAMKEIELSEGPSRASQTFYKAQTDEEKALDRRLNLKLDLIVVAILAVQFILCGIDKTNVGFVATSTFPKDAHLKGDDIPNSLSLFSATYVPLQPVMVMLARRIGVHKFIPIQVTIWGGLCMAHAGIKGSGGLIGLRVLIGAAEAGFTQIGMYYMSTLYPKAMFGLRAGLFTGMKDPGWYGMYSIAGAFAGLIAYGLLQAHTSHLHGWQVVFLVEGGLTIFVGILSYFVLPGKLATAWFLTEEERLHAVRRMERDLAGTHEVADSNQGMVTRRDMLDVLKDWKKLCTVLCNMTAVLPVTAFTTFLPLVVAGMGYKGNEASLMSVSPFVVGVVGLIIFVTSSDYFRERSLHVVVGMGLGIVGIVVMATSTDPQLRYGFTHVCLAGVFVGGPLIAVWLAGNTPWKGSRSVILGINGWSNLAGVIAGQLFKKRFAPRYETPLFATIGIMVAGMLGFCIIRTAYFFENRRRHRIIRDWTQEQYEEEAVNEDRRGDQRLTFIYGY